MPSERALKMKYILILISLVSSLSATVYLEEPKNFKPKVEIVGCFLQSGDEILILHRQNHKMYGNFWAVPGGKMDRGETPLEAAMREVREETGYDLSDKPLKYLKKVYIETDKIDFVYHMLHCPISKSVINLRFDSIKDLHG